MKFDTTKILTDRLGKAITEKTTDGELSITTGIVVVRAIDLQLPEDKDVKAEDHRKRDVLACKIMSQAEVELTAKEVVFIQERVCNFGTLIAGQIIKALEKTDGEDVK